MGERELCRGVFSFSFFFFLLSRERERARPSSSEKEEKNSLFSLFSLPPILVPGFKRDKGGLHIRFVADNPGVWLFHCHTAWHLLFGQALVFVVAPAEIPGEPPGFPKCPAECVASIATWNQTYVTKVWGSTDYDIGPVANRSSEARG